MTWNASLNQEDFLLVQNIFINSLIHYIFRFRKMKLLHCFAVICFGVFVCGHNNANMNEHCIVGAGPGGLQMGYFFQKNGWDYKIFDRSSIPGKFPKILWIYSILVRLSICRNRELSFTKIAYIPIFLLKAATFLFAHTRLIKYNITP